MPSFRNQATSLNQLFGDDMPCHCSGRPVEAFSMVWRLERCIADVSAWCRSRRLPLNGGRDNRASLVWFSDTFSSTSCCQVHSLSTTASSSQWPSFVIFACESTLSCQYSKTTFHVSLRPVVFLCIYAVYTLKFVDNPAVMSLLLCCRDLTTVTLCSPVFQPAVTVAESPERGSETRARPETTRVTM